jgi:hypothetical protein
MEKWEQTESIGLTEILSEKGLDCVWPQSVDADGCAIVAGYSKIPSAGLSFRHPICLEWDIDGLHRGHDHLHSYTKIGESR